MYRTNSTVAVKYEIIIKRNANAKLCVVDCLPFHLSGWMISGRLGQTGTLHLCHLLLASVYIKFGPLTSEDEFIRLNRTKLRMRLASFLWFLLLSRKVLPCFPLKLLTFLSFSSLFISTSKWSNDKLAKQLSSCSANVCIVCSRNFHETLALLC